MIHDQTASVLLPVLGGLVGVGCCLPTVVGTWHGRHRPSWVSWSVWSSTTGLGGAASIAAGSPIAAIVPVAAFVRCALMFLATAVGWRRYREGRNRTTALEWACLGLCVLTGVIWQVTGDPVLALLAAIATDGIASGPTWRLAWQRQESALLWAGAAATPALALLVIRGQLVSDWAYPVYELMLCASLTAIILMRRQTTAPHEAARFRRAIRPR